MRSLDLLPFPARDLADIFRYRTAWQKAHGFFALNIVALVIGPLPFGVRGIGLTVFDVAGAAAALGMLWMLTVRVVRNLRELARLEPPRR